jgi:hypothetical protein
MFDLKNDPDEMVNVYGNPEYAAVQKQLHAEYARLRKEFDCPSYEANNPVKLRAQKHD